MLAARHDNDDDDECLSKNWSEVRGSEKKKIVWEIRLTYFTI